MTRRRIKLAWIANNIARKASLKKRRLGLVKKMMEFTTLCGIEACLIIYSPEENDPMLWSSRDEVERLLGNFRRVPEIERWRKTMNLESYLQGRLSKLQEQLMKLKRKNNEVEAGYFMHLVHQGKMRMIDFNVNELRGLIWFMETRARCLKKIVEYYKGVHISSPSQGVPPPPPQVSAGYDIGRSNTCVGNDETSESFLWNNWFDDTNECRGGESYVGLRYYNPFDASVVKNLRLPIPSFGGADHASFAHHVELPRPSYGGSSSILPPDFGQQRHSFHSGSSFVHEELRLPGQSFGGSSGATPHLGLNPFETFIDPTTETGLLEEENFGTFGGHDMGPGHYPFGPLGSSSPSSASEFEGNHFGFFGGESSNGGIVGGSAIRPFDDINWPNNP